METAGVHCIQSNMELVVFVFVLLSMDLEFLVGWYGLIVHSICLIFQHGGKDGVYIWLIPFFFFNYP